MFPGEEVVEKGEFKTIKKRGKASPLPQGE